jgi:NOL1/NOP2/fmu family ribosome biogenesis protein
MPNLKILNNKEIKEILASIENQHGAKIKLDAAFLKNNKNRVFLINKEISKIDTSKLRVNSIGMYFCEIQNEIRLSIEGSQIVGPKAKKNIVEINDTQAKKWMSGEDLELKGDYAGFVILKNKNYYLGCGKFKENRILNYVGKERRVSAI